MAGKTGASGGSRKSGTSAQSGDAKRTARSKSSSNGSKTSRRANGGSGAREVGADQAALDEAARQALRESDKRYYRIGEVSKLTGVKAHVLRYWETEFRSLAPPKTRSKQRLYRKRDIEFVWLLKRLLWTERYTIAGARRRIQDLGPEEALALLDQPLVGNGEAAADATPAPAIPELAGVLGAIEEMQSELLALRGQLADGA